MNIRHQQGTAPYFAEGTEAMLALEAMVDKVGVRNVIWALASICGAKAEHLASNWQDTTTAKTWERWANRIERVNNCQDIDPLA